MPEHVMTDRDEILTRLDRISDVEHELSDILQTVVLNDSTILDALAQMLGAIQRMNTRSEQTQAAVEKSQSRLEDEVRALAAVVARLAGQPPK
jgi:methyl-accepting chemotaxis protein